MISMTSTVMLIVIRVTPPALTNMYSFLGLDGERPFLLAVSALKAHRHR